MTVEEKFDAEIEDKIDQLKKKLINEMKPEMYENNYTFYRFLKVCDFNLDRAEVMLKKNIAWRKENNIDTILTENILSDEVNYYYPSSNIGFDKEDVPVKYFAYGNMDIKGFRKCAKYNDRMRCHIQRLEEEIALLEKQSTKVGRNLIGTLYVVDMQNFTFATATDKEALAECIYLARLHSEKYPERLKAIIFLNVSTYFSIAFSVVKSFVEPNILKKVQIYASPDEWKPVLLKLIDADVLPAFLGGNKTDPDGDPSCKSFIKFGGPVPSNLFITKSKKSLSKQKDVKKLTLSRAAFSEIEVEITEAGSYIQWEFETKTRDIGFGLFLKELDEGGEEKITELVALLRLDTEEFAETGLYKCEKIGTYVILFDNSYSWVRSKEIYYKLNVVSKQEYEKEVTS